MISPTGFSPFWTGSAGDFLGLSVHSVSDTELLHAGWKKLNGAKIAAKFHAALQVEAAVVDPDGRVFRVAMAMNLEGVQRRRVHKDLGDLLGSVVTANALNHLRGSQQGNVLRDCAQPTVSDKICITMEIEPCALTKPTVELTDFFLIDPRLLKLRLRDQLKLLGLANTAFAQTQSRARGCPPEADIIAVVDLEQELQNLGILKAAINIVATEDIELIVLHSFILCEVFGESGIATVDISDDMHFLIRGQVDFVHPDTIQLIGLQNCDAGGNLLRCEPSIHLLDCLIRNLLQLRALTVPLLYNLNRDVCKVDTVDAVLVLLAQGFVAVHLRGLGICGVDHGKLAVLHTDLQKTEQRIPDHRIIRLIDNSLPSAESFGPEHIRRISSAHRVYGFRPCCSIQVDLPQPALPRRRSKTLISFCAPLHE